MIMNETYEQMRRRHDEEVRAWVQKAIAGGKSINRAAVDENINVGTLWRLVERYGRGE
jgi:hypothetical protein